MGRSLLALAHRGKERKGNNTAGTQQQRQPAFMLCKMLGTLGKRREGPPDRPTKFGDALAMRNARTFQFFLLSYFLSSLSNTHYPLNTARWVLRSLMGCTSVPGRTLTAGRVCSRTAKAVFHSLPTGRRRLRSYCSREVKG